MLMTVSNDNSLIRLSQLQGKQLTRWFKLPGKNKLLQSFKTHIYW